MPSKEEHIAQAQHNEDFVSNTDNPFFDWKLTGIFYTALQYVDAYLATKNVHPPTHSWRLNAVNADPKLRAIRVDYRDLLNESRTARYEPPCTFGYGDAQIALRRLNSIKSVIVPMI